MEDSTTKLSEEVEGLKNELENIKNDFNLVANGMSEEEKNQECSRCLRCDHFGFGIFKGGRNTEW